MKITKSVGYAIQWLSSSGKSPADIALELKLTTEQVVEHLEKNYTQQTESKIETKSSQVKSSSKDMMIRHTRDKKNNSVSIMTGEASMLNDELKKNQQVKPNRNSDCIFRPNG
jgi:hypothetical protein